MNNKYKALSFGIFCVFILSAIDASQDLWSSKNIFKSIFYISLVAIFASLPAYATFTISKYVKNPTIKFNFYLLSLILILVSLFSWSYGVIVGEAPVSGAQQMHLIFWPILIPIISLIIFVVLLVLLKGYRYINQPT